jgi:Sel1 repeat.
MQKRNTKQTAGEIGQDLFYGNGVRKNYRKAFPYLLEAANSGLAIAYLEGLGTEKNEKEGLK